MIYSIRIYKVDSANLGPFVMSVRHGGLYRELVEQLHSGYIGCDLLSSNASADRLLLLEFWQSEAAFRAAQMSPEAKVLALFLRNLATNCEDLGAFGFLPPRNLGFDSVPESGPTFADGTTGLSHDEASL